MEINVEMGGWIDRRVDELTSEEKYGWMVWVFRIHKSLKLHIPSQGKEKLFEG